MTTPEEAEEVNRILAAKNFFEVLEVDPKQELVDQEDELRRSYLSKSMLLDSNKCDHPKLDEAFAKLCQAYDTLKDPEDRLEHKYKHYGGRPQDPNTLGALLESMFNPEPAQRSAANNGQPRLIFTRPGGNQPMVVRRRPPQLMAGAGGVPPIFRLMQNLLEEDDEEQPQQAQTTQQAQPRPQARPQPQRQPQRRESGEVEADNFFQLAGLFGGNMGGAPPRQADRQPARTHQQAPSSANGPPRSLFDLLLGGMLNDEDEDEEPNQPRRQQPQTTQTMQGPGGVRFMFHPPSGGGAQQTARPSQQQQARAGVGARERFNAELNQLKEMGFSDERRNLQALIATRGNVDAAVNFLVA